MIKHIHIFNNLYFLLFNNDGECIGRLRVLNRLGNIHQGILSIYIKAQYRSRWLFKQFAKDLYSIFCNICKLFNFTLIITRVNNPKSIKLLEFFNFSKYNNNYYYLQI